MNDTENNDIHSDCMPGDITDSTRPKQDGVI